ncbi:hypothetical protein BH24DEI2_BH24DEI2_13650 [soil metagenome]
MALLLFLGAVTLVGQVHATGKAEFPVPLESWQTEVESVGIVYHFVDLKGWDSLAYARAEWRTGLCHVYLDVWLFNTPDELVNMVLHEVGHCMDLFKFGFDHNGLAWGDCSVNSHDCRPEERFAEAWRVAYLQTCGRSLYPVGFPGEQAYVCELPDRLAVSAAVLPAHVNRIADFTVLKLESP